MTAYFRIFSSNNTNRRHILRNITTQKHTIKYILILVMIAITVHVEAADNSVELPDGVEARLGKGRIFSMQYSDDGTRLALATSMGVWIYDTVTYKEVYLLKGHDRRPAQILAFSTDGKMLATAAMFGTVNFWDTDTGEHQHQIIIEEGIVKVVFGIDGSTFCILGGSGSVMLFDILNWEEKHNYENILDFRKEGIFSMAISPDSFNIVTGHQNGRVAIYDAFFEGVN